MSAEIRDWLTAIGTVGAVIVAVAAAWWAERRSNIRRPALSLAFDTESGIATETAMYVDEKAQLFLQWPAAYLRFEVTNARGKDAAEDAEVLLVAVRSVDDEQVERTVEISFPGFQWTHTETTRLTIPPGVTRSVDIGRVHEGAPGDLKLDGLLELAVLPAPANRRHRLKPARYSLLLVLAARNADAVEYTADLLFDPSLSERAAEQLMIEGAPRPTRPALQPAVAPRRLRRRPALRG